MESIVPECTKAKIAYENCFNVWYTNKFLKGKPDNECDALYQEYQKCVLVRSLSEMALTCRRASKERASKWRS
jgi:hypothetical protein